ncbi:MAG TPA: hypothetical protein VFI17_13940 [Solirubrobacterales bacterium]|nr:hypothetical protein [Solirubrobacterales bacterium]
MSKRKVLTFAILAVGLLSGAAFGAVAMLGGREGPLPILAAIIVLGIGADQISKLVLEYNRH